MKKSVVSMRKKIIIGVIVLVLTSLYLFGTTILAQGSEKIANTGIKYNRDYLSWGDVWAFDSEAWNSESNLYKSNPGYSVTYYSSASSSANGDKTGTPASKNFYNYASVNVSFNGDDTETRMKAHSFTEFNSNVSENSVTAPIDSSVSIPVVTTSGTGIYSVVPDTVGTYTVFAYSESGTPAIQYYLINDPQAANGYSGANSFTNELNFSPINGANNWYFATVSVDTVRWHALSVSCKMSQNSSASTGTTGEGGKDTNMQLSTTYYRNEWSTSPVYYNTVLSFKFGSSIKLGPITKSGDTFNLTNDSNKGTVTVQNIFGVNVGTSYNGVHIPLFITATPTSGSEYSFTGVNGGVVSVVTDDLYRFDFEGEVSLTAKWEKLTPLPTFVISGGAEGTLDFYFTNTSDGSYINSIETGFIFTPNWGETPDDVTISYSITGSATDYDGDSLNSTGQITKGVPFAVRPCFGDANVTFANTANDKTITFTISSKAPDDSAAYFIKGNPSITYNYLDKAIDAAGSNGTVVVGKSGTAYYSSSFEYTLPSDVTLLIPFDEAASVPLYSNFTSNYLNATNSVTTPAVYKSLTFKSGYILEVYGQLCPASKANAYDAVQTGNYGCLVLDGGSRINVQSGGSIHCFGYIKSGNNGTGKIYFYNNAKAYELMTTMDYPGSASSVLPVYNAGAFPYREYYFKGIQTPAVFYNGSTEQVLYSLWGSSFLVGSNPSWVNLIGSDSNYFMDTSTAGTEGATTSVTKSYDGTRQKIELDGNAKLHSLTVSIQGNSASTANTDGVPIPSKFDLIVNSGNVSFNENIILGRGATATVNSGAKLTLPGKNVYVLDSADDKYSDGGATGGDAQLDINGTVIINDGGGLYTTENKAAIVSIAENGKIEYKSAPNVKSSIKIKSKKATAGDLTVTLAELKNKDNTYTSTTDASANDLYAWNKNSHKWEKNITITTAQVHFNPNEATSGSMSDQIFTIGVAQNLTANGFERTGYEFAGWGTYPAQSSDSPTYTDEQSITLSEDLALYALWKETTYTATFKNYDGSILSTTENVTPLRPASYTGAVPVKPSTPACSYEHSGWRDESTGTVYSLADGLPGMTQDTIYTATFTEIPINYTITWNNEDGTLIDTTTVAYGVIPTHANPTKTADAQYTYTFSGWTPEVVAVTGDANYTAVFTETANVAKIGTAYYTSLKAAVTAAQDGDTITMLADEALPDRVDITGKSITLDLNGHTVSRNGAALRVENAGTLTVKDSAQNGTIQATGAVAGQSDAIVVLSGGTLTLESGTIRSNTYGISSLGTVTVTGGTVIGDTGALYKADTSGTITVSGGWFSYDVKTFCVDGYGCINDSANGPAGAPYAVRKQYVITWKLDDGTTIDTTNVVEGETPTHADPTKAADAQYTYTFSGWTPELAAVTGDAEYTATFTPVLRSYTITWKNGDTVLETDAEVPYGTMPSYDGATPTKTDKEYTYTFTGWDSEPSAVTGNKTYTAQFSRVAREYSIKLNYQTLMNNTATDYDNKGATVKYTYPATIKAPSIRYYNLDHWTVGNSTESVTTEDLPGEIKNVIDNTDEEDLDDITVKAFFVRKTYTVSIYSSKDNGKTKTEEAGAQNIVFSVGRSYWINASAELENGAYKFDHWLINGVEDSNQRAACWFGEADEGKAIEAIACYVASSGSTEGTAGKDDAPRVTVRDYFTEENNGVRVIGMTLEVIAPEDMTNYEIAKDGNALCVGFKYSVSKNNVDSGAFSKRYCGGWDTTWRSGTYVMRYTLDEGVDTIYAYGYLKYTLNGVEGEKFATLANPNMDIYSGYDTTTFKTAN